MFKQLLLTLGVGVGASVAALAQDAHSFAFGKPGPARRAAVFTAVPSTTVEARPHVSPTGNVLAQFSTSSSRTIIQNLESQPGYEYFVQSAERAVLVQRLQSAGPYTVFAPVDAAFGTLPSGRLDELWKPANRALLYGMLATHIVVGDLKKSDLTDGLALHTLAGTKLIVHRQGNSIELEDPAGRRATLSATDLTAANGTIHTIDALLAQP